MTIPNCPLYCDTNYTHLSIPPPQITDACGTSVVNISPDTVPIITAPQISVDADTLTCSGIPFEMSLLSCVPNTTISHWGNGVSGSDTIFDTVFNNSNVIKKKVFLITLVYFLLTKLQIGQLLRLCDLAGQYSLPKNIICKCNFDHNSLGKNLLPSFSTF